MRILRKVLLSAACLAVAIVVLAAGAMVISPWPSVLLISMAFAGNDAASEAALARHVPEGIVTQENVPYGDGPDEFLDISQPLGNAVQLPLIVWVHGGGFISGSKEGVANYLKILASEGYVVAGVEYSTAPGSTYPTPVRQVSAALAYLVAHSQEFNLDPDRIVLAGDSAGAQIAAQTAMIITDAGYASLVGIAPAIEAEQLRAAVLVSGAFDMSSLGNAEGLAGWFVRTVLWSYSGMRDFLNDDQFARASITPNVTSSFPPTFITSGDADPLEPQAQALLSRLQDLGIRAEGLFFTDGSGLNHEYQFDLDSNAGRRAFQHIADFLTETVL